MKSRKLYRIENTQQFVILSRRTGSSESRYQRLLREAGLLDEVSKFNDELLAEILADWVEERNAGEIAQVFREAEGKILGELLRWTEYACLIEHQLMLNSMAIGLSDELHYEGKLISEQVSYELDNFGPGHRRYFKGSQEMVPGLRLNDIRWSESCSSRPWAGTTRVAGGSSSRSRVTSGGYSGGVRGLIW